MAILELFSHLKSRKRQVNFVFVEILRYFEQNIKVVDNRLLTVFRLEGLHYLAHKSQIEGVMTCHITLFWKFSILF